MAKTKRIKLNEAQLKKLVREAVLSEIYDETHKKARKTMAQKYRQMFINRVQNMEEGKRNRRSNLSEASDIRQYLIGKNIDLAEKFIEKKLGGKYIGGNASESDEGIEEYAYQTPQGVIVVRFNNNDGSTIQDIRFEDSSMSSSYEPDYMQEGKKSRLNKIISESIRKVLREGYDEEMDPLDILLNNSVPFVNEDNASIEVLDADSWKLLVTVLVPDEDNLDDWKFRFVCRGSRKNETDLECSIVGGAKIEYCSPGNQEWDIIPAGGGFHITIENCFDYEAYEL